MALSKSAPQDTFFLAGDVAVLFVWLFLLSRFNGETEKQPKNDSAYVCCCSMYWWIIEIGAPPHEAAYIRIQKGRI
jgi:hypothetical protein